MAILVQCISVVIKAEVVEELYPGGWQAFREDAPNRTLCADGELVSVAFMSRDDVQAFVEALSEHGIRYLVEGKARDLVVVDESCGILAPCNWLRFGSVDWESDPMKKVTACMRVPSECNRILAPLGWTYEQHGTARPRYVEVEKVDEQFEFLRHEDSQDVYRDRRTGEEFYVGRTTRP